MQIKDLLPIGTIVLLKEGEKRLMINGIMQADKGLLRKQKKYDYIGVLYPEGHISDKFQYLFNHEDIDKIIFRGFEDTERNQFIDKLIKLYGS